MDFITLAMRNSLSTTGILADSIFYSLEVENQFNKDSKLLEDSGLEIVATNPEQHLSFNSLRRAPGLGNLRSRIAQFLKLPIQPTRNLQVLVGNSQT